VWLEKKQAAVNHACTCHLWGLTNLVQCENPLPWSTDRSVKQSQECSFVVVCKWFSEPYFVVNPRMDRTKRQWTHFHFHNPQLSQFASGWTGLMNIRVRSAFSASKAQIVTSWIFAGPTPNALAIARAIVPLNLILFVADEPLSALDVVCTTPSLNLMMDKQEERNLSYLFYYSWSCRCRGIFALESPFLTVFRQDLCEFGTNQTLFSSPNTLILKPYYRLIS